MCVRLLLFLRCIMREELSPGTRLLVKKDASAKTTDSSQRRPERLLAPGPVLHLKHKGAVAVPGNQYSHWIYQQEKVKQLFVVLRPEEEMPLLRYLLKKIPEQRSLQEEMSKNVYIKSLD
ncbi:hypothetical protein AV530_019717 [Patagioenas fasciata monilis]|uniref:Uncharacterized protein n=1 Tax=Patagioenas fasciata monilis TaxID=372326 RepID=A0A1V4JV30_PATFA|nr:hypothetical protein AV530_019717 [Patagioenas fasciata monilis]